MGGPPGGATGAEARDLAGVEAGLAEDLVRVSPPVRGGTCDGDLLVVELERARGETCIGMRWVVGEVPVLVHMTVLEDIDRVRDPGVDASADVEAFLPLREISGQEHLGEVLAQLLGVRRPVRADERVREVQRVDPLRLAPEDGSRHQVGSQHPDRTAEQRAVDHATPTCPSPPEERGCHSACEEHPRSHVSLGGALARQRVRVR